MSALTHRRFLLVAFVVSTSMGCDPELAEGDYESGESRVELCSDTCERCSTNTCRACGSGPYGCYC